MLKYKLLVIVNVLITITRCENVPTSFKPYEKYMKILLKEPPVRVEQQKRQFNNENVKELWFDQKLDHFTEETNNSNNETWLMRYLCNDEHYKAGGPIFIFVGGEWEISEDFLITGHFYDMAKQHAAMLYYTEHRYYGKSMPVSNFSMENFKYLNVRQALADLAYFIEQQKAHSVANLQNAKVVLAGGSYAGSMVAWFGQHYSHLFNAAWATSAPLIAKLDFHEYMQYAAAAIKQKGSLQCYKRLQNGLSSLASMLRSPEAENLLQRLNVCTNFMPTNALDVAAFFNGLGNYFATIVQVYSNHIKRMCNRLISLHPTDDAEALIQFITYIYWPSNSRQATTKANWCLDTTFASMLEVFNDTQTASRQWFYQTCNEFGWYPTAGNSSNSSNSNSAFSTSHAATRQQHPFAHQQVTLHYFQQLCQHVFGSAYSLTNMSLGIEQTNNIFANVALTPPGNVFFTHGQLDPWRAIGLQKGKNVIVIPGYSHTADLSSININDTVAMNVAKLKVAAFISRILRNN